MRVLIILSIILVTIVLATKCKENFDTLQSTYTHPNHNEILRNPNQPPGSFFRPSNTFLVASPTFEDAMDKLELPKEVNDQFTEWIDKGFLPVSKDQMSCGGCWAFATCGTIAARIAIATNGKWDAPFGLSDQYMISCANVNQSQGCQGGVPQYAIDAMSKDGIPKDIPDINSYTKYSYYQTVRDANSSCSISPASTCPCSVIEDKFQTGNITGDVTKIKNNKYTTVGDSHTYTSHGPNNEIKGVDFWPNLDQDTINKNVQRMKKAIYYEGPVTVGIGITADFYKFVPTVDNYFQYDGSSQQVGGHAVTVVGWKKIGDVPVWICKNSWGDNWGYGFPRAARWKNPITGLDDIKYKGGFWNHRMGFNDIFIESNAVGGHPNLKDPDIEMYLPNNGALIPADWYKTMTLRDIYEHHNAPNTPPDDTKKKSESSFNNADKKVSVNVLSQVSYQNVYDFFVNMNSAYIIAGTRKTFDSVIKYLPVSGSIIDSVLISNVINNIKSNISDYVVVGIKGSAGVIYFLTGDSAEWNLFNAHQFIGRTVDPTIATNIIYAQITSLQKINSSVNIYFASSN
jgi:C1A family cysteine protease